MTDVTVSRHGRATLQFVEGLHGALDELWRAAPEIPEADRALFGLAVIEIATNIVEHSGSERHPVTIEVDLAAGDQLRATLRDDAEPVDVDLSAVTMADALAESGRGLAIAAAVCDQLSLERGGGNIWRLARRIERNV